MHGVITKFAFYSDSIPPTPFSPSLISPMVSVDVKHHVYLLHPRPCRQLCSVAE